MMRVYERYCYNIVQATRESVEDQEVIPAPESDAPDGSREEQEVDMELCAAEDSPMSVRNCHFCVITSLFTYCPVSFSPFGHVC